MRTARLKVVGKGAYYHVMNRVAGYRSDRPFDDKEKQALLDRVMKFAAFYDMDIITLCIMSNHWHAVIYTPSDLPSPEVAIERYNAYKGREATSLTDPNLLKIRKRMINLSSFMQDVQQWFTNWYNRTRSEPRTGSLWGDRFKSVILENCARNGGNDSALWNCVKYIELNPVRAGIVQDPADYHFSSWGICNGSGKHPFAQAFHRHMGIALGDKTRKMDMPTLQSEFRADIARTVVAELGGDSEEILAAYYDGKAPLPRLKVAERRVRYWSDGAIIGSKRFVHDMTCEFFGPVKAAAKRYGKAELACGAVFYALRRLRKPLGSPPVIN